MRSPRRLGLFAAILVCCAAAACLVRGSAPPPDVRGPSLTEDGSLVDVTFDPPIEMAPKWVRPGQGGIYIIGSRDDYGEQRTLVMRLLPDGTPDPAYVSGRKTDPRASLVHAVLHPDGTLTLFTYNPSLATDPERDVVRLRPDGTIDPTFFPDPKLRWPLSSHWMPIALTDGRLLIASISEPDGTKQHLELRRFTSDGRVDLTLPTQTAPVLTGSVTLASAQNEQGQHYIAATGSGGGTIIRVEPNGTLDSSWTPREVELTVDELIATRQGLVMLQSVSQRLSHGQLVLSQRLSRMRLDGTIDPVFGIDPQLSTGPSLYGLDRIRAVVPDHRGGLLIEAPYLLGRKDIFRLDEAGKLDPEFSLEVTSQRMPLQTAPFLQAVLEDGSVIVSPLGENDPPLRRIIPDRTRGDAFLANLSLRCESSSGEDTAIAGFYVKGGATPLVMRAVGPGLAAHRVADFAEDPRILLFRRQEPLTANDDWWQNDAGESLAHAFVRVGAFPFAMHSRDAALQRMVEVGPHSIHAPPAAGAGIVLLELFHDGAFPNDAQGPRLANLAGRARVGSGSRTLIAGFSVQSPDGSTCRVLIRAVGPGLKALGIKGPLADPELTLYRDGEPIAHNNDWSAGEVSWDSGWNASDAITAASTTVGAFPLAGPGPEAKDAALLITLPRGNYTAHVTSRDGSSGVALVEIYEVP